VHQQAILYPKTRQTTLGRNATASSINAIDETSRVNGSRWGGVQAYWTGEAAALTATKPKFRQIEMKLQKLTGLYYATDELLKDSDALGQVATEAFTEEFGFKIDDAIMRGTGAGMPEGIIGHAGTVSITKETNQQAATILKENIDKMFARMLPQSLNRAEWYINQDCWPQLFSLAQAVGVGGVPMFVPTGGIGGTPGGSLYGRPIVPIEQADTCGTVGDITFADFSQYRTIDKGGIEAASSIHVLFLTDEMTFRFILRMDGQPIRNSAITPFKGTNTLAPFVTLASRA
jgi:HK97 family phage major capsid protein